jgi:hypothetical protein
MRARKPVDCRSGLLAGATAAALLERPVRAPATDRAAHAGHMHRPLSPD